jgi:hypothetical protein
VLDGDSEAIVALLGGDLSRPHQFIRVYRSDGRARPGTKKRSPGRGEGSSRLRAGRSISCTTSRARRTGGAGSQSTRSRCVAHSTNGRRRAPRTGSWARRPTRSTPGRSRATPRVACYGTATHPRSSTRCLMTATSSSRGRGHGSARPRPWGACVAAAG